MSTTSNLDKASTLFNFADSTTTYRVIQAVDGFVVNIVDEKRDSFLGATDTMAEARQLIVEHRQMAAEAQ